MKNILNLQWQILSPELRVALKIDIIICKFIKKNFCHVLWKKGKESASDEKERNKNISKTRAGLEHTAGSIKRCRIVSEKFRNWARSFAAVVMAVACALHNFRLKSGPWQKADADDL